MVIVGLVAGAPIVFPISVLIVTAASTTTAVVILRRIEGHQCEALPATADRQSAASG